jgi:hypothetical protein
LSPDNNNLAEQYAKRKHTIERAVGASQPDVGVLAGVGLSEQEQIRRGPREILRRAIDAEVCDSATILRGEPRAPLRTTTPIAATQRSRVEKHETDQELLLAQSVQPCVFPRVSATPGLLRTRLAGIADRH